MKRHPGAVLVFVGVVGEGLEIIIKLCLNNRSPKFDRTLERLGASFWIVLVIGLWMELSEAAKSDTEIATLNVVASSNELARVELERQIAQTSINVLKIDPRRQSVVDLSAYADISFNGGIALTTNRNRATRYCAFVRLWSVRQTGITNNLSPFVDLSADKFDGWDDGRVQMILHTGALNVWKWPLAESAGELLDKLDALNMDVYFLSNSASNCVGGFLILTINSLLSKRFDIPPQSVIGIGTLPGATNQVVFRGQPIYGSDTNLVVYDAPNKRWIRVRK